MPRTRLGVVWRFLLAGVVVIACAAGTTAVAGLLEVKNIVDALKIGKPLKHIKQLTLPPPGAPQTLLLIGADHRIGEGTGIGNTDTMMLARINDNSATINLLSIPRDLEVQTGGGGITKLNAIYSESGPDGLLSVLKDQVFPGLKVNHIVIVSFLGFSKMIDAIGCVYTMVDHRYYNNTAVTDYSSINIEPGYQRLCGDNAGANGALAFVRFRHTDSDLVREARQQDFIRWAKEGFSTADLLSGKTHLINIFAHNIQTDQSLDSTDGLINLANLAINANGHTLKSFPFPVDSTPTIGTAQYVVSDRTREEDVYRAFMTPTRNPSPALPARRPAGRSRHNHSGRRAAKHAHHSAPLSTAGLIADAGDGHTQAAQLGKIKLPVYFPYYIVSGPYAGYCSSVVGNCDEPSNPSSEYDNSYPRKYWLRAPNGTKYPSYVMTLVINPALGEYYNVQGTTWRDPPILRGKVARVKTVNGRKLYIYENGGNVSVVSFHTAQGVYWISNTLTDSISNSQMLAMASSLTLLR